MENRRISLQMRCSSGAALSCCRGCWEHQVFFLSSSADMKDLNRKKKEADSLIWAFQSRHAPLINSTTTVAVDVKTISCCWIFLGTFALPGHALWGVTTGMGAREDYYTCKIIFQGLIPFQVRGRFFDLLIHGAIRLIWKTHLHADGCHFLPLVKWLKICQQIKHIQICLTVTGAWTQKQDINRKWWRPYSVSVKGGKKRKSIVYINRGKKNGNMSHI